MRTPVLHFLGHSTVRMELAGRRVLTDPVLTPRVGALRRVVPHLLPRMVDEVDLVLISHLHGDHLHVPSLQLLGSDGRRAPRVVVPAGAGDWLRRRGVDRVEELAPGGTLVDGDLTVTATPAVHDGHRWGKGPARGPHAPAMGHLLRGDGVSVYAAGDTDLFPGMAGLGGGERLDVALLPVWGWGPNLGPGHLDPRRAAEAVLMLRPLVAVPVHWGALALAGMTALPTPLRGRMRRLLVDPPHRFAAAVAATGVDTRVAVTRPGAQVLLEPAGGEDAA